ncbi:MAG: hypothetical protein IID30_08050 [Planctomycetes bacterium]|nr:hypothetical protein [Planctomycetota bacterium]
MMTGTLRHLYASWVCLVVLTQTVGAGQILIAPGQAWEDIALQAKPGDEIILMPGTHRAVTIKNLRGTKRRPIIIRGLDAKNPSIIDAKTYGIRLVRPRYVNLSDLNIVGALVNGILIDNSAPPGKARKPDEGKEPDEPYGNIILKNIHVERTGVRGQRHAIFLIGMANIRIEACRITGWAGSGIEIVGCTEITIRETTFTGLKDFAQLSGVRIRAGSTNVEVSTSRFENCGLSGVCVGGASNLNEFFPKPDPKAQEGSIYEARQVRIDRNTFLGGATAITMTHCERAEIWRNTIIRPEYYVFCLLQTHNNELVGPTRRCTIGGNLISWQKEDLVKFFLIDDEVDLKTLKMDPNLWWTNESAQSLLRLGQIPADTRIQQIFDVDPKLNQEFYPTNLRANGFGAFPIKIVRHSGINSQ